MPSTLHVALAHFCCLSWHDGFSLRLNTFSLFCDYFLSETNEITGNCLVVKNRWRHPKITRLYFFVSPSPAFYPRPQWPLARVSLAFRQSELSIRTAAKLLCLATMSCRINQIYFPTHCTTKSAILGSKSSTRPESVQWSRENREGDTWGRRIGRGRPDCCPPEIKYWFKNNLNFHTLISSPLSISGKLTV